MAKENSMIWYDTDRMKQNLLLKSYSADQTATKQLEEKMEGWNSSHFPEFWVRLMQLKTASLQTSNFTGKAV